MEKELRDVIWLETYTLSLYRPKKFSSVSLVSVFHSDEGPFMQQL